MDISPEAQIGCLLCPGRTYLFKAEEHHGDTKHFHVILNADPADDEQIVMVTATTITIKHMSPYWTRLAEKGVVVQAIAGEAEFIKYPTVFRCDSPVVRPKNAIITKLADGTLKQCGVAGVALLEKLRQGLIISETVDERIKELVRGD